jgi:hypothetical protein
MAARVTKKKKAAKKTAKKPPKKRAAAKKSTLSAEWTLVAPLLTAGLESLKQAQYLILASIEAHRFVQFAVNAHGRIRGEVVSDYFLGEGERLSTRERKGLSELGWAAPTHADDAPTESQVKGGSPNWHRDFAGPKAAQSAAHAAATVLWTVFKHAPPQVRYQAFARSGDEITLPLTGILPEEEWVTPGFRPDSVEDLREMVLETLRGTEVGTVRDVDGVDIAVDIGERSVFVTAHDEPMSVLLYSVVGELDESPDALKLVNDLNRSRAGSRAILYEGHLLVDRVLPGDPFVPRQLVDAVIELVAWANAVENAGPSEAGPEVN